MDTRRLIVALIASMAVFYVWIWVYYKIYPQQAAPPGTPTTQTAGTTQPAGDRPTTTTSPAIGEWRDATPPAPTPADSAITVRGGDNNNPILLGNAATNSPYPLQVEILPQGASVRSVQLRDHKDEVKRKGNNPQPYPILGPVAVTSDAFETRSFHSFATKLIHVDLPDGGYDWNLERANWQVEEASAGRVTLSATLELHQRDLVRIRKTYTLKPQAPKDLTSDLDIAIDIENLTQQPISVGLVQRGPIGLTREDRRSDYRAIFWADYTDQGFAPAAKQKHRKNVFENRLKLSSDVNDPTTGSTRIAWVGSSNKYFGSIMAPVDRSDNTCPIQFAKVEALHLTDMDADTDGAQPRQDLTFEFTTVPTEIPAGESVGVAFDCYIGAKMKTAFKTVAAYRDRQYVEMISANFYACAPTYVVWVMMGLLEACKAVVHNYGIAIFILVLVVRVILHPITKKSQVNMFKMQKDMARLQPKIQAVKEKYAKDRQRLNQETMKVYKEEGVNPAGGMLSCLPMMLQMPIWMALWAGLNFTVEMRHQPFDGWWIRDLTAPDALVMFNAPVTIPLLGFLLGGPIHSFNLLPILLSISQMLQMKYMPRATAATQGSSAGQQMEQQRKMMMIMSVMFMFILYNAPSGLNLYIMTSNLFGILEQWRIRKHLNELEEKRKLMGEPVRKPKPEKKNWLRQKYEDLEKKIEEAKRIEGKKKKKRSK